MTCAERRESLSAYVDDELAPGERAELDAHLAGCATCREALAAQRRLAEQLAGLPAAAPPGDFEARFWARIAREQEAGASGGGALAWLGGLLRPRRLAAIGGLAAAAVALVLVLRGAPENGTDIDWQIAADPEAFELLQDPDLDIAQVADLLEKLDAEPGRERGPG
jgi:anti-sigma factor RsiW